MLHEPFRDLSVLIYVPSQNISKQALAPGQLAGYTQLQELDLSRCCCVNNVVKRTGRECGYLICVPVSPLLLTRLGYRYHLNNAVFRGSSCEIQFTIRMTQLP